MKPEPHGHSYAVFCSSDAWSALPDETGEQIGCWSKAVIDGKPIARHRERLDPGACVTHYPVIFTDPEPMKGTQQ